MTNWYDKRESFDNDESYGTTTFDNLLTEPMKHASDSLTLALTHNSKPSFTNQSLRNDFVVATSIRATLKMGVPVKTQNNAFNANSAVGLTSPKIATCLTGFAPYNAKVNVLSANSTICIGTTSQRPVLTKDIAQRRLLGRPT